MSRARAVFAIDPKTRQVRRGALTLEAGGALEFRLPYRLQSPNRSLHAHWRTRHREKQQWRIAILEVIAGAVRRSSLADFALPIRALGLEPVTTRRRVVIERLVGDPRALITDDDNLAYSGKFLVDQLTRLGFVRDDSRQWVDREVRQAISPDGLDWTVIRIEPTTAPAPVSPAESFRRARGAARRSPTSQRGTR